LAQDLLELDEADVVIAAGADAMTESMLAMIGRFATTRTTQVRPFDRDRTGVLLGEGAAAVVLVGERAAPRPALARLLSCGLSCDASHETIPDEGGIVRAMNEAFARGRRAPADVDLVVAHGTGTALNDPTEALALERVFGECATRPLITAIKGAIGHTSGAAALMSVDVGIRCLAGGVVPAIVGLAHPLSEGAGLRFATDVTSPAPLRLAQINAFGFGGVNAVSLLEATA